MTSPAGSRGSRPEGTAPFDAARWQDARYSTRFTSPAIAAAEEAKTAEAALEFSSEKLFFPDRAVARVSHDIVMGSAAMPSERSTPGLSARRSLLWLVLALAVGVPAIWGAMQLRKPAPEVAASQPPIPERVAPVVKEAAAAPVAAPPVTPPVVSARAPQEIAPATAKPVPPTVSRPTAKPPVTPAAVVARREPPPEKIEAPARPAPATVFLGSMTIESEPSGAQVFVNGQPMGTTPVALQEMRAGSRVVRILAEGYQPWSSAVRVVANQQTRVSATLQRPSLR